MEAFGTVLNSMFLLFRVMSGAESNDESAAIDALMQTVPAAKCAFVFFMVFSSWTLLPILTAVISENMISTTAEQESEMKLQSDEEDRIHHHEQLRKLFHAVDEDNSGEVDMSELISFISDKENAHLVIKSTRVPTRNVVEVIKTLGRRGKKVDMDTFLECMSDVGAPVQEHSIMRLEAQITDTQLMIQRLSNQVSKQHGFVVEQMTDLKARVAALEIAAVKCS